MLRTRGVLKALIFCAIAGLALGGLSSCTVDAPAPATTGSPNGDGRMAGSFVELLNHDLGDPTLDLSDFERDVLERAVQVGYITALDYDNAEQKYFQCMDAAGLTVKNGGWARGPDGIYFGFPVAESQQELDAWAAGSATCSKGTTGEIEPLYRIQQDNPGLLSDQFAAVIDCWNRDGVGIPGYTADDLRREITTGTAYSFRLSHDAATDVVRACLAGNGISFAG